MGSIFPCEKVEPKDYEALIVKSPCDESLPTRLWNCVRPAPPVKQCQDHPGYGFTAEEVEAVPNRERIYRAHMTESNSEWSAPPFTEGPGYVILKMPQDAYDAALAVHKHYKSHKEQEGDVPGHYSNFYGQKNKGNAWDMVNLDSFQKERAIISRSVWKVLSWWSGRALQHEATYGIRVYHRDAVLLNHRDVMTTHLLSAVLQVGQTVEEGWPLYVERNRKPIKYSEVYLQPGYMALYEGTRLKHGRPKRFNGTHFAMIFVHTRPIDYYPETEYKHPAREDL